MRSYGSIFSFLFVCLSSLFAKAESSSLGTICYRPESPVTKATPAVYMSLDRSKRKFVSNKAGQNLFDGVKKQGIHSIQVFEDRNPPITLSFNFENLGSNLVAVWKKDGAWKILALQEESCRKSSSGCLQSQECP